MKKVVRYKYLDSHNKVKISYDEEHELMLFGHFKFHPITGEELVWDNTSTMPRELPIQAPGTAVIYPTGTFMKMYHKGEIDKIPGYGNYFENGIVLGPINWRSLRDRLNELLNQYGDSLHIDPYEPISEYTEIIWYTY